MKLLDEHKAGLQSVADALLEKETIDGAYVGKLVDEAYGRPVPAAHAKPRAPLHVVGRERSQRTRDFLKRQIGEMPLLQKAHPFAEPRRVAHSVIVLVP